MKTYDLDALLHPAQAFHHPSDVVRDRDLTVNEKRAILTSWAADAGAFTTSPALQPDASGKAVGFVDLVDALRQLDKLAGVSDLEFQRMTRRRNILRRARG
jgi:hypothetical protein